MAQPRVALARSGFPAPMFWAPRADTVESMEEGTRNKKPIIFSTMPTAAASVRPRRLAMMVMTMKETWMKPSCKAMGMPIFSRRPITARSGRRSAFVREMPVFRLTITRRDTATLTAWDSVVPMARPTIITDSMCITWDPTAPAVVLALPSN